MPYDIDVCCIGQTPLMQLRVQDMVAREAGLKVSSASGLFKEAVRNLSVFKPDVIVVSVGQTCPEIKMVVESIHRASRLPIIVMGGSTQVKVAAEFSGIHDFILYSEDPSKHTAVKRNLATRIRLASTEKTSHLVQANSLLSTLPQKGKFSTRFTGVLALGASCGGTEAIAEVLKMLPENIPGMAIVQHMPAGFTKKYAERLDRECTVKVVEAVGLHKMQTGKVLLAPGDVQMRVVRKSDGFYTECFGGQKVSGHRPSVDVLFSSVAKCAGKRAVGIILTGMGSDGAKGLLEMHRTGAYTIGQDERSCVVYGMPRVAFESGAVQRQAALRDVAPTLLNYLATAR